MWFEMLAHEQLVHFAEQIDIGSAEQGAEYNRIDRIDCPVCAGKQDLIRMVDPQQPHIWFESCQNCFGRFYDAGEFTDLAEHGFLEWIRDLDAPERPLIGSDTPDSGRPARPPRSLHPQLRIGVPGGSTRRNICTRLAFGFTTTGARAACSSGRSALLSE